MIEINLSGQNKFSDKLLIVAKETLKKLHIEEAIFSLNFLTEVEMKKLNKQYRGFDKSTDVLSFPVNSNFEEEELGDIFICGTVVEENALHYHHSIQREYCFVIIHGILHLLGYDHIEEAEATEMFELQAKLIEEMLERELI